MTNTIIDNEAKKRYELQIGDQLAFLVYMPAGQNRVLTHTEVPKALEGQGLGGQLARHALETAGSEGYKVIVTCPFVLAYIGRHPEYKEVVFGYRPVK